MMRGYLKEASRSLQYIVISLAVAAQIPCDYCIYYHTEAAKLNGATASEIQEAVALASLTRQSSTLLNGLQVDKVQFKKEPQDLNEIPALAIRRDLVEWELRHHDGASVTVNPRIGFAANRQTILVEAAIAGLGVANLPLFMVGAALNSGALVRVMTGWEPSPVEMTAPWPSSLQLR